MRNRFSQSVLALLFVCLMVSCAVKTPIKTEDLATLRGNTRFDCVRVMEFTSLPSVAPPPWALSVAQESTIDYLRSKNIFRDVSKASERSQGESCAVVEANLVDMRMVPTVARVFGGALAGRSHMIMKVRLTDAATGSLIAEQELTGAPNAWASAYSINAADRRLPAAMGSFIGDFVLGHSRKP